MKNLEIDFPESVDSLIERFKRVWNRNLIESENSTSDEVAKIIINKHQELHRHYHNTSHLTFCLSQHSLAKTKIPNPDIVELSLWFHDVIYIPSSPDNEQASAELFLKLSQGQLPDSMNKAIVNAIKASTHQTTPLTDDEAFVLDIDLASIGLPWEEFNRDNEALRAEAPRIHDNLYYEGKTAFLSTLLKRKRIYYTEYFFKNYEQQARNNIERYMKN